MNMQVDLAPKPGMKMAPGEMTDKPATAPAMQTLPVMPLTKMETPSPEAHF